MSGMRLRSIRMKNGGATIHVLHTPIDSEIDGRSENLRGKLIGNAKQVASYDGLDGYIVIGLFSDGTSSVGFRIPPRIPDSLLPSYIAEMLRRDAITEREAERVFDSKFEWVDR